MDHNRLGGHPNIARAYHHFVDSIPTPPPPGINIFLISSLHREWSATKSAPYLATIL
jgi:hypothetical protein